jgi:hypothetical protein
MMLDFTSEKAFVGQDRVPHRKNKNHLQSERLCLSRRKQWVQAGPHGGDIKMNILIMTFFHIFHTS